MGRLYALCCNTGIKLTAPCVEQLCKHKDDLRAHVAPIGSPTATGFGFCEYKDVGALGSDVTSSPQVMNPTPRGRLHRSYSGVSTRSGSSAGSSGKVKGEKLSLLPHAFEFDINDIEEIVPVVKHMHSLDLAEGMVMSLSVEERCDENIKGEEGIVLRLSAMSLERLHRFFGNP